MHAHVLDVAPGLCTRLTSGVLVVRDLAWAPDGRRVALVTAAHDSRDLDGVAHVFTVHPDGGELKQVTEWHGTSAAPPGPRTERL